MEKLKSCCIFGYPDVEITQELYNATAVYLANEVVLQGCRVFYFCRAYQYAKTKKNKKIFNLYDTVKLIRS